MADPVVVITPDDHAIQYVNLAWEKLTGYASAEAVNRPAFFIEADLTPKHVFETMWATLQAGEVAYGTLQGKRHDGTSYEVKVSVAPERGEHGQFSWFIATFHDVTERRKIEAQKANFLAGAANDIRNPMSSLKLRLYLLGKTPERYHDHIAAMEVLIEQIDAMVNDLVLVTTLSHGKQQSEWKRLNINDVIKRVTWANWPLAHDKGLTLTFNMSQDPLIVLADADQIERAVVNLVSNALNFTLAGGKIQLSATQSGNEIIFTVQDTGIGINPQTLPFIFEQFYRRFDANCGSDNSGMGLAIVKAIVDQHGGHIEAESSEGQGSLFRVYLPAA